MMTDSEGGKARGWVDFKTVKAQASFETVLNHYAINLKRKGSELTGVCPFHEDTKASFHVNLDKKAFNCFGCGAKGNIIDFVAKKEGTTLKQSASLVAELCGIVADVKSSSVDDSEAKGRKKNKDADVSPIKQPEDKGKVEEAASEDGFEEPAAISPRVANKPLGFTLTLDASHSYLKRRGLNDETIERFGLGYCDRGILRGRIAIPIHNERGELLAYAGRLIEDAEKSTSGVEKYRFPQNFHKSLVLFNLNRVPEDADCIVVVEGYFSVFWLTQCGHDNVVALMGTSLSQRQKELICERFKRVMLFFDGDDAGRKASFAIAHELAKSVWVRVIPYLADLQPDKVASSDLNDLLL